MIHELIKITPVTHRCYALLTRNRTARSAIGAVRKRLTEPKRGTACTGLPNSKTFCYLSCINLGPVSVIVKNGFGSNSRNHFGKLYEFHQHYANNALLRHLRLRTIFSVAAPELRCKTD